MLLNVHFFLMSAIMSITKQGFHWKSIEEKPQNWETVRSLIQDAYIEQNETPDRFWENALVYKIFLDVYPQLKEWIHLEENEETVKNVVGKKKQKKPGSRKNEIRLKVEEELIRREIESIRFDPKTLQPMVLQFDVQVCFFFMIIVWNFMILRKKKQLIAVTTVLDAIISFNRLYDQDIEKIKHAAFRRSVVNIRDMINKRVTSEMYHVLFQNPKLLVESTTDKRATSKKLYKEQKFVLDQICDAVRKKDALLLGNQMPTGTGKTFLAVPLAQKISKEKLGKTVLFTCANELVNRDVASTALLADDLHLWLAKLVMQDGMTEPVVLLRPHKRCFPATWKHIYKKEDKEKMGSVVEQWGFYTKATGRIPDIIVADLDATNAILREAVLIGNPFVAYIDEFVSDDASNRLMAKICRFLPRQTVLLSSILPQFENIPNIVRDFCGRHGVEDAQTCLQRVATADVNIACAVIDADGYLRMPHHLVHSEDEIEELYKEIQINPRIRRCYPAKHVYSWSQSVSSILMENGLSFYEMFPDIGKITNTSVIDYAVRMIAFLQQHPDQLLAFQQYRPQIMPKPERLQMFTEQSCFYEGKTLYITKHIMTQIPEMTCHLFDKDVSWTEIVAQTKKNEMLQKQQVEKLDKAKINRNEKDRMVSDIMEISPRVRLPSQYVINSRDHFARFHQGNRFSGLSRVAIDLPTFYENAFDDHTNLMMAAGIGIYSRETMTEYQRNLVMDIYDKLVFLCSGKDIVFGTNLPGLTNVFIDDCFAKDESLSVLYQLMGRVGRMGRSYHANIIVNSEEAVQKIMSFGSNIDQDSTMDNLFAGLLLL